MPTSLRNYNLKMAALKWTIFVVFVAALCYWLTADRAFDAASIAGQRVLITGTSSGIGEQLAYAYSRLGARVLLVARRQKLLENVGRRCEELGAKQVVTMTADLAVAADRERVIAAARDKFDGEIDQLILNHVYAKHGQWTACPANVTTLRVGFEVNFFSYVELASMAAEMLSKAGGRIGVITSVAGKVGMAGYAFYSSSKFALDGFFSSWRSELQFAQSNISITNCVLGLIATEAAIDGIRQGHTKVDPSSAASVESTAEAIMRGVSVRARELYYPFMASFAVTLHKFLPQLVESISAQMTL